MRAAARECFHQRVHSHIPRARIEGEDILRFCMRGNYRDVGDAADVQGRPAPRWMAVQQVINEESQRGALSSGGYIRWTKIRNGGDACAFGNYAGLADLQRRAQSRMAEKGRGRALVIDCLTVRTNQRKASQRNAPN